MEFALFGGSRLLSRGDLAMAMRAARAPSAEPLVLIDELTGRVVDLDPGEPTREFLKHPGSARSSSRPSRGRPKLGVIPREVTLLPRHWDWLAAQPGGASAALRRLVDQARKDSVETDAVRQAQEVVYRVMTTLAGDRPGYEEATRALFARDRARFEDLIAAWPTDVAAYVGELSARVWPPSP